jgi:hypothetical protein
MAFLTVARIAGDPDALLERYRGFEPVMTEVGRDHGLLVHAVAMGAEGLVQVNLWPSREGSEAAARDPRRLDVVSRAGLAIHREHFDVPHYVLFERDGSYRSRA